MAHGVSASLGQTVGVAGGAQYTVSFMYKATGWDGAGLGINYYDSSWTKLSVYPWQNIYYGNGTDQGWQSFTSPQWNAPANAAYLEVHLDAWGWSDTYYDNVSVNVVPEPGVGALLGLGGLLVIRRWNSRARR
jgi:hypothetical protein